MLLSSLPTELRQMIIQEVLTTPLSPPSATSEVRRQHWFYPHEENTRRHSSARPEECNPAIAFNTQEPWGTQYLPLLQVNKALRADTEDVLRRIGRFIQPTLDVMLEDDGDFKASWLLVPPSPSLSEELNQLNITIRTLECMKVFGAEGSQNGKRESLPTYPPVTLANRAPTVPLKRNTNVSVARLLQRIITTGFSPYLQDRKTVGTPIRKLRINVVAPADTKHGKAEDEKAPLAARLSEYFSLGYFAELGEQIQSIDVCVDDRRAYAFSGAKGSFVLEWSHKWRRDSAVEE